MSIYKFEAVSSRRTREWRESYHYAVYEHRLSLEDGKAYSRCFVVIKNQYDVIAHFTSLHNYIDAYTQGVCIPITSDGRKKLHHICSMLNYILIEQYETFRIEHIFGIKKEMLEAFFQDYALGKQANGTYRDKQTVNRCVAVVTGFFRKLSLKYGGYMELSANDLYAEKTSLSKRGGIQRKYIPNFQVRGAFSEKVIFRDIPTKVLQVIISNAFRYTPEIAFAICLQAFAGLRPGEVCNVRQESSPLGSGLSITTVGGVVKKVEIDLSTEYMLRSDGIRCGGIKKKRRQRVYPAFLTAFCQVYEFHKRRLQNGYETEYCPMFIDRNGMAMTYSSYQNRFRCLITEHVRTALLNHNDPECRLYGQLLYENPLGPHALRHWFSVQLVLMSEDIAGLQYWRGDSSPDSALVYLQNKGDLVKELSAANELFANFLMSEGGLRYGKND